MTESRLLIENFYFKQLLNEEVAFNEQYSSLLGDRTQEFFEYYCDGLNAQKELILALECVEISEKILQEKFGDQFAARVAGLGSKATKLVGKLATGAGLGGKLGSLVQNKFDVNVDKDGSVAYINARNKNFTRSLGDYLGQLKTFDNTIPDKIGLVPVQKSGWLKGIAQKGGQILKGGSSLALAGVGLPVAALTGTAFAGVNGLQQLTNKLNEVFDAQWKKIQNTQPVQDFDRLFEEKKQSLRNKLSKTDKEGKETSKILQSVDALAEYAKKNPAKSGIIIALMTATIGLSAGTLGFGILTVTQLPILTGAVAFFLRTGLGLLKGEKASTAVGGALKAAAVGWITGKLISSVVGPIFDNMIKVPQPAILRPDIVDRVTDSTGKGWVHEKVYLYTNYEQHMSGEVTNPGTVLQGFRGQNFYNGQEIRMDIVTTPENANYIQSISDKINKLSEDAWNTFQTGDQAGATAIINKIPTQLAEVKKIINIIANDPNNTKLVNAFKNYDAVMGANADVRAATKAFNDVYLGVTQGVASGVASAAGGAIGAGASVGASGKLPVIKESTKLSDILKKILAEAEAAAPVTVPPVPPGAAPVNPDKLSGNQQDAVANLKKNIEKEIRGYIKDVAKTFKVKGKTTTELLDGLRKEPKAKSAVEIIDSILGEFPKYKLEFPKDVTMDDKEASTPPTPATPDGGGGGGTAPDGGGGGGTAPDGGGGGTAPGGGGGGGGTAPGGGGGGGGTAPGGGGGGGGGTAPGGGGGGGGTAPGGGGGGGGTTPGGTTPGGTTPGGTTPGGTTPGGTTPGGTTPGVGGKKSLTPNDLRMVKAFLSKVYDLSLSVKSVDLNAPTKSKMRPVISNILDILDIATGQVNPSIKINKKLDSAFQGLDVTGQSIATPTATPSSPSPAAPVVPTTPSASADDYIIEDRKLSVTEVGGEELVLNLSPDVKKQFNVIKSNPLISGDIVTRIADLMKMNIGNATNIKYAIGLISTIKDSISNASTKTAIVKQLGGNVGQLRKTMLAEDITSGDIATIMKEIKALMTTLVSLTYGLRQATSSKNKTNKEGVVLKAKVGAVVYVYKYTNGKWFVRGKDKQFTEPVVDEKIIKQLTDLAATGKNDAEQIQKDDEEKAKLKKADDEKAADEKDTKAGIEKTKSAADATRASATPEKKKKAWDESFKSEYKNYF